VEDLPKPPSRLTLVDLGQGIYPCVYSEFTSLYIVIAFLACLIVGAEFCWLGLFVEFASLLLLACCLCFLQLVCMLCGCWLGFV